MLPQKSRLIHAQSAKNLGSISTDFSEQGFFQKPSFPSQRIIPNFVEKQDFQNPIIRNFKKIKQKTAEYPPISSDSYCVISSKYKFDMVAGQRQSIKRKIASLTKIMTLHCSLKLMRKFNINALDSLVKVKQNATVIGTVAGLKTGDYILLEDLFYALMLPSGNDAAVCLADFFGKRLKMFDNNALNKKITDKVQIFINYMNKEAIALGMHDSM